MQATNGMPSLTMRNEQPVGQTSIQDGKSAVIWSGDE